LDRVDYQSLIVQDLVNSHSSEELNLNPWYQRRSVWSDSQKAYLINTLFEQKPIPTLYIRHSIDLQRGKSIKEVVDGQQRSRAIIEYFEGNFQSRHVDGKKYFFSQLTSAQKERFLLTQLPIGFLLGASDSDVIDIFARINSVSKSLNTQEKLNARFGGEFKQFCIRIATRFLNYWRVTGIFSANSISRMEEVGFVSDLIFNMIHGLSDYRPSALEKMYKDFDEDFPTQDEVEGRLERVFDCLLAMGETVIKETVFRRPPMFFSLFLVLDSLPLMAPATLAGRIFELDARIHDTDNENDIHIAELRGAMSASTQRLSSRRARDRGIRNSLQ
jgi:hypothetical protein